MSKYDDIINLEYRHSKKHPLMSIENRAAQFSPFAALTGYDEEIKEVGRLTDEKVFLNEDKISDTNNMLIYLNENKHVVCNITYFVKDNKKSGGHYDNAIGNISKIDLDNRVIVFKDKSIVNIDDIVDINI